MKIRTLATLPVILLSASAMAQDASAPPTYGTVELATGFMPDPHEVQLAAGGSIEVTSELGPGCAGFVANAPDVDLVYTAGDTFPLNIYVQSEADTTLVVNLPDGTWLCNDDTEGFNPALSIASPQSGLYDIWVGNYGGAETPPATLRISEIEAQF